MIWPLAMAAPSYGGPSLFELQFYRVHDLQYPIDNRGNIKVKIMHLTYFSVVCVWSFRYGSCH